MELRTKERDVDSKEMKSSKNPTLLFYSLSVL
jgi:hypothetical protein